MNIHRIHNPQLAHLLLGTAGLVIALLGGTAVQRYPLILPIAAGVAGFLVIAALGPRSETLFLGILTALLVGFLFYSRAFAYIGIPPLYISEPILVLGLVSTLFAGVTWRLSGLHLLLVAFMSLGLARTLPYLSEYGTSALRDAATWYYALFALLVSVYLTVPRLHTFLRAYGALLPILVAWLALLPILSPVIQPSLTQVEASQFPVLYVMKPGDRAVVLAGIAAFVITGLYTRMRKWRAVALWFWPLWAAAALTVVVYNRGGMLALAATFGMFAVVRPTRQLLHLGVVGLALAAALLIINPTIDLGYDRTISVEQIRANVLSIFSEASDDVGAVQGTKDWRLDWWGKIVDRTVYGPYFWTGQGFGINLASEYGFQTDVVHEALRSPHSIHMTILARMGVPGLLLWISINAVYSLKLVRTYLRARRSNEQIYAQACVWLLAIWLAALVNASFDVYLESPYGAIPFWCALGAGMKMATIQMEETDHEHTPST